MGRAQCQLGGYVRRVNWFQLGTEMQSIEIETCIMRAQAQSHKLTTVFYCTLFTLQADIINVLRYCIVHCVNLGPCLVFHRFLLLGWG